VKLHVVRYNEASLVLFISFGTIGLPALVPELKMEAAVFRNLQSSYQTLRCQISQVPNLPRSCSGCLDIGFDYTLNVPACHWSMGRGKILFLSLSVSILLCYKETENQMMRDRGPSTLI